MSRNRTLRCALVAVGAAALAAPMGAAAHVTIQPGEQPAGGFSRLNVRVPNERDNAATTKVVVQIPPGFYNINYEKKAGWDVAVKREKLPRPVEQFGEQVTEQVSEVSFTAADGNEGIEPGQFEEFGLSGGPIPGKPGQKLTFPAIQTYDNDEIVRWISKDPEAETPASTVTLVSEEEEPATQAAAKEEDDDSASKGLGMAALIIGIVALLAGLAALAVARRRPAA